MDRNTFEKYKTNIKNIDDEHWVLFDLMNEIDQKSCSGNLNFLNNLIDELRVKVRTHYYFEEKYMEDINYPHVDDHKNAHNRILRALENVVNDAKLAPNFIWLTKTLELMQIHHIEQHDLRIAEFVNSKI